MAKATRLLMFATCGFLAMIGPAGATSPSFDCRRARLPTEIAICRSDRLSELDNLVAAGYAYVKATRGQAAADEVGIPLWKERNGCGFDVQCIARAQIEAIEAYQALGAPIAPPNAPAAGENEIGHTIPYGSRAGMEVTVTAASGLDSREAVIRVAHTRANARSYCVEYAQNDSEQCIEGELAVPLGDAISADCETGMFTTLTGQSLQFTGLNRNSEGAMAKYRVVDLSSGQVLDGSEASGYPTFIAQFAALCPSRATPD